MAKVFVVLLLLCCPGGFKQVQQCLIGYLNKLLEHVLSLPGLLGPRHALNGVVGRAERWQVFCLHQLGETVSFGWQIHQVSDSPLGHGLSMPVCWLLVSGTHA